mmetsp:Transcript_27015/g.84058  ORF Transcript_27015/g.84058 Transcript_27015/m.84058 type:complete len:185 (-) Transcript_27015:2-556(-)
MYGALDATQLFDCEGQPKAAKGAAADPDEALGLSAGRAAAALLQLFLWVGAWGAVDEVVGQVAPSRPERRFALYSLIASAGAASAPLLIRAQRRLRKQGTAGCGFPSGAPTGLLALGFAIAVALCSGLWGMIDSVVELLAGDRGDDRKLAWYCLLTVLASLGVAVHHQFWPHQLLGEVGQLTIV